MADLPELLLPDVAAWHAWLVAHEGTHGGVWLVLAKKGVTEPTSLTYAQALDEALCGGWIDGQLQRVDDRTHRQRFTPRRPRSLWSARNVGYVARLTAEGRMRPRGLAEVAAAQADGRWEVAYAGPRTAQVPPELAVALASSPAATAAFAALSGQDRYSVIWRVGTLRTAAGRERAAARHVAAMERDGAPHRPPAEAVAAAAAAGGVGPVGPRR
ncbi:YdeI/OmpD-associated family protein, partial [Cellulomonas endophytica]|uniref:YdeI/OmpD-associated family protein n=1 Tax=Cellulomonas endophytica TaxID=2494735 RepID=UPI0010104693